MKLTLRSLLLLMFFAFASPLVFAQPANDDCANAMAIGETLEEMFTTIDATTDGLDHVDDCASNGTTPAACYNDIWYLYTAGHTGQSRWTMCGFADFDTKIFVYGPGAMCAPGDADIWACNEDGTNCANSTSSVIFDVTEGDTYLLRLGGYGDGLPGESGSGTFRIEEYIAPDGPPNNDCADAIVIMTGLDQPVDNVGATLDGPEHPDNPCFGFGDNTVMADMWYTFTPDATGTYEWSLCNTVTFDSRLAVYAAGATCPLEDGDLIACNDDGAGCTGFTSSLIFEANAGETHLLRLGGYDGGQGTGTMYLTEIIPPEPPANDACTSPNNDAFVMTAQEADDFTYVFEGTTIAGDFDNSTFQFPECLTNTNGGEFSDVWFSFSNEGLEQIEIRFNVITDEAIFYYDVWEACDSLIPTSILMNSCNTASSPDNGFVVDTISGFPGGEDHEYLLRVITRLTSDFPGDFFFQLVNNFPVGVNDVSLVEEVLLYPNPTSGAANLKFNLLEAGELTIQVNNILGQQMINQRMGAMTSGIQTIPLDVSTLDAGIYLLSILVDGNTHTMKFVKE